MKEITITIHEDASIEVDGKGFVGPECDQFMGVIEQALGPVAETKKKPEYNRVVPVQRKAGR